MHFQPTPQKPPSYPANLPSDSTIAFVKRASGSDPADHPHVIDQLLAEFVTRDETDTDVEQEIYAACDALHEYVEELNDPEDVQAYQRALEQQLIQLLNHEQLYFAAVLVNEAPLGEVIREESEPYNRAANYALDGILKYGPLAGFCEKAALFSDRYLARESTKAALHFRLGEILESRSGSELRELHRLVEQAQRSGDTELRSELAIKHRARAEELFLADPLHPQSEALRRFFWLEEWLESESVQAVLAQQLDEQLANGMLLEAAEFVETLPLSPKTLKSLKAKAELAVRSEKAKIAAGFCDSLSQPELALLVKEPLNTLVKVFGLPASLRESR